MIVEKKRLLGMIVLRLVILPFLLMAAVFIQSSTSLVLPLTVLYSLVGFYFLLSFVFLALTIWSRAYPFQAYLQVVFDLLLVTCLVYISGGVLGSLHILYVLVIISASYFLTPRAAYLVAALSAIMFGLLLEGLYYRLIPYFLAEQARNLTFGSVLFTLIVSWVLFFAVAFLMNSLMRRLRRIGGELQLAQKELAVKESQAMAGRISAQIAHEIRNPLTAIAGAVQVLSQEPSREPDPERRELMRIVLKETERVTQTLEQFMGLVAPRKAVFETMDLAAVLQETLFMLRQSGELNGRIELEGNFDSRPVLFYGSANQFKQIFWNLIKNSLQAMPDGGRLRMNFESPAEDWLRIRIADTGVGMTEEARQKLFEPFFSGFESGQGLGTAVVRRVVDDYRGQVRVESVPPRGTEVVIELPVSGPPAERKQDG